MCSWESKRPPKPRHRVRILAPLLTCRCGSTSGRRRARNADYAGATPAAGSFAEVTYQRSEVKGARVLTCDLWPLASSRWCNGRIRPSEGLGPGSSPGRDTRKVLGVCRTHPTPRRSWTRFDSWRGHSTTSEPDGSATACKAACDWVRLPPTSLFGFQPISTRTRCVCPSSASRIARPSIALPSTSSRATPRSTPLGFATSIS